MSMNDDLREALNDTAGDMAQAIPNPEEWSNWIIYFHGSHKFKLLAESVTKFFDVFR